MLEMKDVEQLGKKLDAMNQKIAKARLEQDMLKKELLKKANEYKALTGNTLPTDVSEVAALRESTTKELEEKLSYLSNAVKLFDAGDYDSLSTLMEAAKN